MTNVERGYVAGFLAGVAFDESPTDERLREYARLWMTYGVERSKKHRHQWGYATTEEVEVFKPSPVGGFCIVCKKLRTKPA